MGVAAAPSIFANLSSALGALPGGGVSLLGGHLTSSDEARAIGYIAAMKANPATAASYLALLGSIKNIPGQVLTWASNAIAAWPADPSTFKNDLDQASAALEAQMTSESTLQKAFGL